MIVGKVALLDVRRSIGYIFSPINRVRRFKKDVKFESVQDSCDRLPCVIASSLKPLSSCHKQCNHILAWCACWKYVSWEKPFCYTFYNIQHSFFFLLIMHICYKEATQTYTMFPWCAITIYVHSLIGLIEGMGISSTAVDGDVGFIHWCSVRQLARSRY